jgi:hypothetical protein
MLIFGTLPKICYAAGMTSYLYDKRVRIFDYPKFAEPFRNQLGDNAERLAADNGIAIEFIRKRNVRKEDRVKAILARRGERPGLVCIFSVMEPCSTYKPWHTDQTHDGAGVAEALRQVRLHSADRNNGQRSDLFQALP